MWSSVHRIFEQMEGRHLETTEEREKVYASERQDVRVREKIQHLLRGKAGRRQLSNK